MLHKKKLISEEVNKLDFLKIEELALLSKEGDMKAKEKLAEEFKPIILNLSKKACAINGYEFEDVRNECFSSLFSCLKHYSPDKHRFVAYATISIKNSVGMLKRYSKRKDSTDSAAALILTDNLENVLSSDNVFVEEEIIKRANNLKLKKAYEKLKGNEKDLINYVYVRNHTLRQYSVYRNLPYAKVVNRKKNTLKKLKLCLKNEVSISGN